MTEWIISGNPQKYDVVGAFHKFKKIDWVQSVNISEGDIIYIYVTGDVKALQFRCRANKVNIEVPDIEDQQFNISGEYDGKKGRYMELELLEEFTGVAYTKEELAKHGFKSPLGPIKMPQSVKEYLESLFKDNHKSRENDSWIVINKETIIKKCDESFFKGSGAELPDIAQKFFEADHMNISTKKEIGLSLNNVRYDAKIIKGKFDGSTRLIWPSVFTKELEQIKKKDGEDHTDLIITKNGLNDYGVNLDRYRKTEYFPSLKEYDPEITMDMWRQALHDKNVTFHETFVLLKMMLLQGGESTCANLAETYGRTASFYNRIGTGFGERVHHKFGTSLYEEGGREKYYTIPFIGRNVVENNKKRFSWKLRDELREALGQMDLSGIDVTVKKQNTIEFAKNMILYGPPGTGKTYNTAIYAVAICEGRTIEDVASEPYSHIMDVYNGLKKENRIAFTTFHQSYGYEEFIEGIKPKVDEDSDELAYTIESGIFKKFCEGAKTPSDMEVDLNTQIWFVRLDTDKAHLNKDKCYKKGEMCFDCNEERKTDDDIWFQERFVDDMQIGDFVVSYAGSSVFIDGIGMIEGEAVFDSKRENYRWTRKVQWLYKDSKVNVKEINGNRYLPNFSIARMSHMKVSDLLTLVPAYDSEEKKPYIFIIDEINRGNISKIFGELITLIEDTKREGMEEQASAILPYSGEAFSVPENIYILGTMNTADRSIALMDTALRRRFQFVEMMPSSDVLRKIGADKVGDLNVADMLDTINERITFLYDREHMIGHAFFTKLAQTPTVECLSSIFEKSVIPLLQEYFYEDYQKIQLVLGDNGKADSTHKFILDEEIKVKDVFKGNAEDIVDLPEKKYSINKPAFAILDSYKEIM